MTTATIDPRELPMNAMGPRQLADALKYDLFPINQPVFVWSNPGVGKSEIITDTATWLGWKTVQAMLGQLDPVDLRGLPYFDQQRKRMVFAPADFWPDEERDGKNGILFWDEMNTAPLANQATAYQMIRERRIGEYVLPNGWQQVAAGNLESDRAVTNRMSSALASRFTHIRLLPDLQDWCRWGLSHGMNPFLVAFLRLRPNLLHQFKSDVKSFPCPRTWSMASKLVDQCKDESRRASLLAGTVGDGAAVELEGFLRIAQSIPDPDAIILNPTIGEIPTKPDVLYALTAALAHKSTQANFDRVTRYAERLDAEFSTVLVLDAIARDETLTATAAFKTWAVKHDDALQGR